MFISFDYKCKSGHVDSRLVKRDQMDNQFCFHDDHGGFILRMTRLPAGTRTTFRFADTKLKP